MPLTTWQREMRDALKKEGVTAGFKTPNYQPLGYRFVVNFLSGNKPYEGVFVREADGQFFFTLADCLELKPATKMYYIKAYKIAVPYLLQQKPDVPITMPMVAYL